MRDFKGARQNYRGGNIVVWGQVRQGMKMREGECRKRNTAGNKGELYLERWNKSRRIKKRTNETDCGCRKS